MRGVNGAPDMAKAPRTGSRSRAASRRGTGAFTVTLGPLARETGDRRRGGRGFTMPELVVALVISAIPAAMALPFFSDREANGAWFREQVKAALRYAQRQAVANRRVVYVFIDPAQV